MSKAESGWRVLDDALRVQVSRREVLKIAAGLGISATATGLLGACGSQPQSGQGGGGGGSDTWRIAVPELKADSVFQGMGIEKGFFEEEGIDAELVPIASGTTSTRALISGDVEMATAGPPPFFAAMAAGSDIRIIGSIFTTVPHLMYVREDIDSLEGLLGESVAGGQPGALLQSLAYALIEQEGLDPDAVSYVNVGGSPDVFQAIVGGNAAGGVAGPDYALQIEDDPSLPVKVLFPVADRLPDYLRNADAVTSEMLEENRDLVVRATAAYVRGARYAVENKDEAVAWIVENTEDEETTAAAVYEEYVNRNLVNTDYLITPSRIEFTQQVGVDTGALEAVLPYEEVATDEVATEAMERLS